MGAIEKTLQALDERVGGGCQVVAICGRNKTLIERLSNRSDALMLAAFLILQTCCDNPSIILHLFLGRRLRCCLTFS